MLDPGVTMNGSTSSWR